MTASAEPMRSRPEQERPTIAAIIDGQVMSVFQSRVLIICGLVLFCDAFNLQILSYAGSRVAADLGLSPEKLGLLVSVTLAGGAIGAAGIGSVADRLGRRLPFVLLCFWFGAFTLLGATATTFETFLFYRFAEGVGLGAALPNANALAAEFSARRHRRLILALIAVGYTAGSAIAGVVARSVIADHGWRALFVIAGSGGIVLGLASLLWLPESIFFLVGKPEKAALLRRTVSAVSPLRSLDEADLPTTPPVREAQAASLLALWQPRFRSATVSLWGMTFLVMLTIFLFSTWTPLLAPKAGFSAGNAISVVAIFFASGTVGGLVIGWLMDRFPPALVLALCWLAASGGFAGLALAGSDMAVAAVCAIVSGFTLTGGLGGLILLSTTYYPEYVRVSGTGWMLSFGRIGAIAGPWLGSAIVAAQLSFPALLWVVAAASLTAAALGLYLAVRGMRDSSDTQHQEIVLGD